MTLPPDFPWRPGMLATRPDCRPVRLMDIEDGGNALQEGGWSPDPNDGATLGALLAEVRRKHGLPDLYVKPLLPGGWTVTRPFTVPTILWEEQWGLTEFDALLAAWNARPRSA